MRESHFQRKVVKILKDKGCWLMNVHGERMQKRGVPDLLVIGLAWKGFIECKIGGNKCTDIQKIVMERIEKRGFPVYVLRYEEELDAIQIENWKGEFLMLVAWEALWGWLKKPFIDPRSPIWASAMKTIGTYKFEKDEDLDVGYKAGAGENRRGRKE